MCTYTWKQCVIFLSPFSVTADFMAMFVERGKSFNIYYRRNHLVLRTNIKILCSLIRTCIFLVITYDLRFRVH
jgi:hypothetical protein